MKRAFFWLIDRTPWVRDHNPFFTPRKLAFAVCRFLAKRATPSLYGKIGDTLNLRRPPGLV
jgi:hypothetical protein